MATKTKNLKLTLNCAKCKAEITVLDVDPHDVRKVQHRYEGSGIECPECKTTRGPILNWEGRTSSPSRGAVGRPSAGIPKAKPGKSVGVDQRLQRRPATVGIARTVQDWKADRPAPEPLKPVAPDHTQPERRPAGTIGYDRQVDGWKTGDAPAPAAAPEGDGDGDGDPLVTGLTHNDQPIDEMTKAELKSACAAWRLDTGGNKDVLYARLHAHIINETTELESDGDGAEDTNDGPEPEEE